MPWAAHRRRVGGSLAAREQALSLSRPAKASRRLAFSEPAAATGVAKNLEGAFGVLRKVGREVVALYS